MAIVDVAYEKWKKDFEAECPGIFKEGFLSGPETALRRDLMRTAYMAGKKAARQPVGQEPAFFVNRWEMEHGTASGLVAMRTGKHLGIRDFFTVPLYAAPTAQCAGEPVAWMTHHDEPMLFPTAAEAAAYCEDDEQPVPLFRSPAQAVDLGQLIPSELAPVVAALNRFDECAEDCDSEGCDIGRDWFDTLTTIGLLKRTQRSPAVWTMTAEGERLLALIDGKAVGK